MRNLAHKSKSGLIDVTLDYEELDNNFKETIDDFVITMGNPESKYRYVKIIDTFFSDTLRPRLLSKLFKASKKLKFAIQIILLNPISESAKERDENLYNDSEEDRIYHLNLGLFYIKNALLENKHLPRNSLKKLKSPQYLLEQLQGIDELIETTGYTNIKLRFATHKRFPLYVFGKYACAGNFLEFSSASNTPWCFWVNDPNQTNDQYDNFIRHFDAHWYNSKPLNDIPVRDIKNKKQIFLSYAKQDKLLRERVHNIIKDSNFNLIDYEMESKEGVNNYDLQDKLSNMFNTSIAVIVILTPDPDLPENIKIPRPNVLIELGRAQSKHDHFVLVLKDPRLDAISNLNGIIYEELNNEKNTLKVKRSSITNFLSRIEKGHKP